MAETLSFQPENLEGLNAESQEINFLNFDKSYRNISSQVVSVYLKNNSENKEFSGGVHIITAETDSYTQDLFLSDDGINWGKEIFVTIPPVERQEIQIKVIPVAAPEGGTGRAVIALSGGW